MSCTSLRTATRRTPAAGDLTVAGELYVSSVERADAPGVAAVGSAAGGVKLVLRGGGFGATPETTRVELFFEEDVNAVVGTCEVTAAAADKIECTTTADVGAASPLRVAGGAALVVRTHVLDGSGAVVGSARVRATSATTGRRIRRIPSPLAPRAPRPSSTA